MFSGLKVIFTGGISSAQVKVFVKRFVEFKGVVSVREKVHPMFKPKKLKELENDVNYIIVENRKITLSTLCQQLQCPEIPETISVVHREWLEQCLNQKVLIGVEDFLVEMDTEHDTTAVIPEPTAPNSKRKFCNDDSMTDECINKTSKQRKMIEFTALDPASNMQHGFNIIRSELSDKPSLLYRFCRKTRPSFSQIIAFDMDGTLISTKSGAKFPKSEDDWKFLFPNIPEILRQNYENGAHLAIISNQNGVAKGHTTITELTKKLESISDAINVPLDIFCSFENDIYRKPRTGSLDFLLNSRVGLSCFASSDENPSEIEAARNPEVLASCLYVGDAAGRVKHGTRKKDFSASDYKLALNANINFSTPEEFFLNSRMPLHCSRALADLGPCWNDLIKDNKGTECNEKSAGQNRSEILLLVGPPACGKSTYARSLGRTHVRINQDLLRTKKACFDAATAHFNSKSHMSDDGALGVVIDATNSNRHARREWIDFARQHNVPIRCIYFEVTKELCFHLSTYRLVSPVSLEEDKRNIEQVVIHSYFKHMEPPELQEGFEDVERRNFIPRIPDDDEAARLLKSYLR